MKKLMYAVMLLLGLSMVMMVSCTKDPNNGGNGGNNGGGNNGGGNTYNGHEYVDLGLPSGTLWATCNVGANSPEGYGEFFAWGETEPKTNYIDDTYKYYYNGNDRQVTRYCFDSLYGYNGFTDFLLFLLPQDDAATANWGNGWCIPSSEQWKELLANTISEQSIQNGVKGYLITASNGKSLFLPAAGIFSGTSHCFPPTCDNKYWTNELFFYPGDAMSEARSFNLQFLDLNIVDCDYCGRERGCPVRPVRGNDDETPSYHTINVSVNPISAGIATGSGTYQQGETCTCGVTANNEYTFISWTENEIQVSTDANYSFVVTTNREIVANFKPTLFITDFEWERCGSVQTGLEEYGLYYEGNYKDVYANIKPFDGVTLYSFDSSAWEATTTDDDKVALFYNDGQIIDVYNNVSVMHNSSYDDVIGTIMPDGTLHLIHVTNCFIEVGSFGTCTHISGQSK